MRGTLAATLRACDLTSLYALRWLDGWLDGNRRAANIHEHLRDLPNLIAYTLGAWHPRPYRFLAVVALPHQRVPFHRLELTPNRPGRGCMTKKS